MHHNTPFHMKLEGHSAERIYLRQESSDGSVYHFKTTARSSSAPPWDFPDVKFRIAAQLAGSL